MDIVKGCLEMAPVPGLSTALNVFCYIWHSIQQMVTCKEQLVSLAQSTGQLLLILNTQYQKGRISEAETAKPLSDLTRLLQEISQFFQTLTSQTFIKSLLGKEQRIAQIDAYHRRVITSVNSFQITAMVDIRSWQTRNDEARIADQRMLHDRLTEIESNHSQLVETLDIHHSDLMAMMVSLQRRLDDQTSDGAPERKFYSNSLQYLSTTSGRTIEVQDWMITSFEVEFGCEIGSGGFGQVFQGSWKKLNVALKVFKTPHGVAANSKDIRREVTTWSRLRHPHVLQFLGANVLDDKPFIVMPFLQNGNARDYVRDHPDFDRLSLMHHVSLGLVYLHSQKIIHGDLKALNILIDDNRKGVLCDFGLSRVRADVTSRSTSAEFAGIPGSRNWMAPERLLGGSLNKPCDIYAFGMTLFEIYTDELPLGGLDHSMFFDLVVRQDIRPERPYEEDSAFQLSDEVWELAEQCWAKDPKKRPTADALCDIISHLIEYGTIPPQSSPGIMPISPESSFTLSPAPSISPQVSPSLSNQSTSSAMLRRDSDTILPTSTLVDRKHDADFVEKKQTGDMSDLFDSQKKTTTSVGPKSLPTPEVSPTVSEANVASLPPGWKMQRQESTGKIFYVNHLTKTVSWNRPTLDQSLSSGSVPTSPPVPSKPQASPTSSQIIQINPENSLRHHSLPNATGVPTPRSLREYPSSSSSEQPYADVLAPGLKHVPMNAVLTPIKTIMAHTAKVICIAVSPNGKWLVSGSEDKTVRVWDANSGDSLFDPWLKHTGEVKSIAFAPDSNRIVSGSEDCMLHVWDVNTRAHAVGPFVGHSGPVRSVAFSPDGDRIASGSDDKTIRVWNAQTGMIQTRGFVGHNGQVRSVIFSPDGMRIASGGADKTVRIWNLSGQLVRTPLKGLKNTIRILAFSSNGERIVAGSEDRKFCVWNENSGALISGPSVMVGKGFLASLSKVSGRAITVSPDGMWVATGTFSYNIFNSNDMEVRLWDPDTGQLDGSSNHIETAWVSCVAFSPDSTRLFAGFHNKRIEIFSLPKG